MKEGIEYCQLRGERVQVRFPDSSDAAVEISNVLAGREYPAFKGGGFRPRSVVDVGANIGAAAIYFASVYPDADIFCFEPASANFEYLRTNTGAIPRIQSYHWGLSDSTTRAKLFFGRHQCLQHSLKPSVEVSDRFEEVELRSAREGLEHCLLERAVLKLDTEGCEVAILKNLGSLLGRVDVVCLEYHSEADRLDIDQLLRSNFKLWQARASKIHRGRCTYLSRRVISEYPELGVWEIRS